MPKRKTKKQITQDKKNAGSLGGLATYNRHGSSHMSNIGTAGARTTWTRYSLRPYGQTAYALTRRDNNQIVKIIGHESRMESILGD